MVEDKMVFAFPRFAMEKHLWVKFRAHCVENDLSVEKAIRKLVVRYMKVNDICSKDVPEEWNTLFMQQKREQDKNHHR